MTKSDELRVVNTLRLKSLAEASRVAEASLLTEVDATRLLQQLDAANLATYRTGTLSGWMLTPAGRIHGEALLADEVDRTGNRRQLASVYERFLEHNQPFLKLCTDWQVRVVDDEPVPNHHDDPEYDDVVLGRLREADREIQPICVELADMFERFGDYGSRFASALNRVRDGNLEWFTKPMIDSYHTVWFELHEDLLASLGIERGERRPHMSPTFGRVLSAMITPFDDNEELNLDAAQALAAWLVESQGHEGLVLAGTTGESPTLTHEEQGQLFRAVREAVDVPIIAGTGSNDTQAAVDLTRRAVAAGVDGLLVVTPYYNRPSQAGLIDHFSAVAAAGDDVPTLIYDIPVRTGRKVETESLLTLAHDVANIVGIKDAAGDPGETAVLLTQAPEGFEIYSGDDGLTLPLLSIGAVGAIGVATHWTGPEHVRMFDAFGSGDVTLARELNAMMLPSFGFESMIDAPNPIPTKAMLRMLGHSVGHGRSPMHVEPPGLEAAARALVEGSGLAIESQLAN